MPKLAALSIGALLSLAATPTTAQTPDFATSLPDERLVELRGGFDLPDGLSVTLGVTTETRVDGSEVLRTVFDVQNGTPNLTVLADNGDGTLSQVTVDRDGQGVATADGIVRVRSTTTGESVDLASQGIDVSHLVGGAFGSVVANSGDNRSVDVSTSIDIGLSGITPDAVGNSMARVDGLALDATIRLVR